MYTYFFLKSLRFTTERVFNHIKAFRDACFGFVGHINDLSFFFFLMHVSQHSDPFNKHSRGFLDMQRVCARPFGLVVCS